jgi:hypothetical protein
MASHTPSLGGVVIANDPGSKSTPDLQAVDRNALKAVAAAISRDSSEIIKEMDLAALTLGVYGRASILYSSSLLKHWVLLCGSRLFPMVSGNLYTLHIDPNLEDSSVVFKILVEDYGTELFFHSYDESIFRNMWPILSALKKSVIELGPSGFPIQDEIARTDILRSFTEKFRCFFIALGRSTNINPVLLMDEFKAEATAYVTKNPNAIKDGSPHASPLLSLFLYSSYVEEAILEVIFPDILRKFRIVIYANSDLGVSASSYQQELGPNLVVVSLFIQNSEHYTVLLNNLDFRNVPVRTVSRDSPLPSWEYVLPPSPFHPLNHSSSIHWKPKCILDASSIQNIIEENDQVAMVSPEFSYSPSLARMIASSFSTRAPRSIQDSLRFIDSHNHWNINSFAQILKAPPQSTDLGYNLLSNPDFNMKDASDDPSYPGIKPIQQKIISRSNRCFVIHIAACLGIHPLILEAQLVDGATRLLLCSDCHNSKIDILKSIISQDSHVNADILRLVFPSCLDGVIVRIVKIIDFSCILS